MARNTSGKPGATGSETSGGAATVGVTAALAEGTAGHVTLAAGAQQRGGSRLFYIDNLRWLMIILVVIMHACVTYSGLGSWYYKEPSAVGVGSMIVFAFYQSFTQAFFMGLLFFVAGIFVSRSYDRKGALRFVTDRLFRLGLPAVIFMLLIHPLTVVVMGSFTGNRPAVGTWLALYLDEIRTFRFLGDSGPLWFAVALLIFSAVYAGGRYALSRIAPPRKGKGSAAGRRSDFTNAAAVAAILVIGVVTFLVRTVQPIGTSVLNMQLCFFTQYIVLFAAGVWAGRRNVIERVSTRFGMHWLKLSLAAGIPAWFLIGGLGGAVSGSMESFTAAMAGGWHWQAAAMAMWESFFCVSFSIGLLVLYRDRVNTRGRLSAFLSANAFGVYVFHTPVLVTISLLLRAVALPALPKTAVVMTLAVVVSFLFAAAVRRVPGLRKVFA